MARNKKRTRMIRINAPKHFDPGKGRPVEELAYISPREKARLLGSTDHKAEMTKHGILSFADDSASSMGMSRGDASQGTIGSDNRTSTSSSPHASRGSAIGGSTSRASQSNIGGSQTGGSTSGSSSSHASASNRTSSSPGAGSSGSGSARGGSTSQGAAGRSGGPGGDGGGGASNRGGSTSQGAAGRSGGPGGDGGGGAGNQPSAGRTPGGGAQPGSGALGQMARSMAPGTRTPGGGAPPASGMLGQMAGPPRAPGSAMGLLGATRAPQKMQDRIGPEPSRGSEEGSYPVGTFNPANPVGRPPTQQERYGLAEPVTNTKMPTDDVRRMATRLAEGTLFPNPKTPDVDPYDTVYGYNKYQAPPTKPTAMTFGQVADYQKAMKAKYGLDTFPVGAFQTQETTIRDFIDRHGKGLGLSLDSPFSPENQETLEDAVNAEQGKPAWEGYSQRTPAAAAANRAYNAAEAERGATLERDLAEISEGRVPQSYADARISPNYNDPVATAGIIGNSKTSQPGFADPGDFGVVPGESPFVDDVGPFGNRMFGDPVPAENTVRINPASAGPTKQITDRIALDPNYQPGEGTYNPTTQRVDYSPEQRARIDQGNALLGTTPLNDVPTDFTGLLGAAPKPIQDRLSPEPTVPKEIQDRIAPSLAGILSPRTRPDLSQEEIEQAPSMPTTARIVVGDPRGDEQQVQLALRSLGITNRPTPTPFTPSTRVPGSVAGLDNYNPPFTPSTRVPGSAAGLANYPRLDQDTEPETAPTDITQQGSWPKDLVPSSGMPQGTMRDRLIQDAVAESEGQDPTPISPEIPVNVKVRNSVTKQYGPDMAEEILATVVAIKGAMGYGTRHGQRGSGRRGRGIGQLAQAPHRRRSPVIPPEAPLLET